MGLKDRDKTVEVQWIETAKDPLFRDVLLMLSYTNNLQHRAPRYEITGPNVLHHDAKSKWDHLVLANVYAEFDNKQLRSREGRDHAVQKVQEVYEWNMM